MMGSWKPLKVVHRFSKPDRLGAEPSKELGLKERRGDHLLYWDLNEGQMKSREVRIGMVEKCDE